MGRYVDPFNGRFISEDALGFDAGDSKLYRYVGNNPINNVDPTGNAPVPTITPPPVSSPSPVTPSTPIVIPWLLRGAGGVIPFLWTPGGGGLFNPLPTANEAEILKTNPPVFNSETKLMDRPIRPIQNPTENPNDECDKDKKTCATDPELKKYANYDLIKNPTKKIRSGYRFIEKKDNPYSGLEEAFKYIKDVRKGQLYQNQSVSAEIKAWWKADIEMGDTGIQAIKDGTCPHPPGFAQHFNVVLKYENLRSQWGWKSSSVGSIGKCQACKDDPNNGPQLVTVFAVLNVKDVGGFPPLR